jgi:UrcA family protein
MRYWKTLRACAAVGVFVAGTIGAATPALGQSAPILVKQSPDIVVRHVSYADLNLAVPAGERTLVGRVRTAVNDLCGEVTGGSDGSWMGRRTMDTCNDSGWDQARPQISLAVQRARDITMTGTSSIAAAALTISVATRH